MTDNENNNNEHDMGIARPSEKDMAWSRMQPLYVQASPERLDQPHQIVDVKNRSDTVTTLRGYAVPTKQVVIDRFNQGHEIQPGETKRGLDMLAHDIEYFMREGRKGRRDHLNRQKPLHPIEIVGYDPDRMLQGSRTDLPPDQHADESDYDAREEDDVAESQRPRARTPRQRASRD